MALSDQFTNLGYKLFRDSKGRMVLSESGGLGKTAGLYTVSSGAASQLASSGVQITDVSAVDNEQVLQQAGAHDTTRSKGSIESFGDFQSILGQKVGNLTNALKGQSGDIITVGNEQMTRAEAQKLLGQNVSYDQVAEAARKQAGLAVANQTSGGRTQDTGVATPTRPATNVTKQSDGTFAVTDTSGNVLQEGFANQAQALATQNQISGGSTPTLSGRPDLFAVQPTQAEVAAGIQPVVPQAGMVPVQPTVATSGQIAQLQAGTLPTPKAEAQAKITDPVSGETFDTTFTGDSENVHVDVPTEFSTKNLKDAFSNPVTNSDFQSMITQITAAQQAYIDSIKPSETTVDLQTQLADIRAKADVVTQSLMEGVANVEGQPIPMQFIVGQASALEKRANIKLNSLARLEANLLDNLGISVSQDQARQAAAEQNYSFTKDNVDLVFQMQENMQKQEDRIYERAKDLKTESRETLASMLEMFKGYTFNEMSKESQSQLTSLAQQSGVPLDLLVDGLKSVQNQMIAKDVGIEKQPNSYQEWSLAGGQTGTGMTYSQWLTKSTAGKDFTDMQWKAADFANRMVSSDGVINQMASEGGELTKHSLAEIYTQQKLPGIMKAPWYKSFKQAGDEFINAVLRRESGAAVTDSEFNRYIDTYFPVAGDGPDVIRQKAESRSRIIQGAKAQSGGAYDTLVGNTDGSSGSTFIPINENFQDVKTLIQKVPEAKSAVDAWRSNGFSDDEILQFMEQEGGLRFNKVGSDTNKGAVIVNKALAFTPGQPGGQCGAFVNDIVGTRMGDSYLSKMSYVNVPNTHQPSPGDLFVMPYKETGHTGLVLGATPKPDGTYDVDVIDSNWSLDEKVKIHTINSNNVSGYARIG